MITPDQLLMLPVCLEVTVEPSQLDLFGYLTAHTLVSLADEAGYVYYAEFGVDASYFESGVNGAFTLSLMLDRYAPVQTGDTLGVRYRLLGYSYKRVHSMAFIVNETKREVAATVELLDSHANLVERRTSPWPDAIAAQLTTLFERHHALDWDAPVCGVLQP